MNFLIHKLVRTYNTGLPTKDETSKTIVRNLYCLFPYIYDSLQLKTCVFLCEKIGKALKWLSLRQMIYFNLGIFKFHEMQVVFTVLFFVSNLVVGENMKESNICHSISWLRLDIFNFENLQTSETLNLLKFKINHIIVKFLHIYQIYSFLSTYL